MGVFFSRKGAEWIQKSECVFTKYTATDSRQINIWILILDRKKYFYEYTAMKNFFLLKKRRNIRLKVLINRQDVKNIKYDLLLLYHLYKAVNNLQIIKAVKKQVTQESFQITYEIRPLFSY